MSGGCNPAAAHGKQIRRPCNDSFIEPLWINPEGFYINGKKNATGLIKDGQRIRVNEIEGYIEIS
jgi:hypothetical protein